MTLPPRTSESAGHSRFDWHDQPPILHELIRAQVRRTPDGIAAVYGDERLSFRELLSRSDSWAAHLRRHGVHVGVGVGICLERSLDLPVIVLAVLTAGGFCVPIEPSSPMLRIAALLDDAEPSLIITSRQLRRQLPETATRVLVNEDEDVEMAPAPDAPVGALDPAYVLFTSGSTGAQKGVVVSHGNLAARFSRTERNLPAAGSCMSIVKTSVNHNPFLGEVFAPLLHACYFAIAHPERHRDVSYLAELVTENAITHLALPTVMLRAFVELPGVARCRSLAVINSGGETVTDDLRKRVFECFPATRFVIGYGTTETGPVTAYESQPDRGFEGIPIGSPLGHTEMHLFDSLLEPTPLGETGEIFLGGEGLALGYLNRARAVAESFVPDPSTKRSGRRLYRSGDLGRRLPDGGFEFRGRVDQQAKVRGFRIELGEVEVALGRHPDVHEAVVLAREDEPGVKRLVAYVVAKQKRPSATQIRRFLQTTLADYMLPEAFVFLDELPHTADGRKVDRHALPAPASQRPELEQGYVAPRTPTETALAAIWAQLLRLDRVGVHDVFFDLGGHSLLAMQAASRITTDLGAELSLRHLFESPTIAELAERVEQARQHRIGHTPPLVPVPRDRPLVASFAQQRLWFLDQLEPHQGLYNVQMVARVAGPLDEHSLRRALGEIERRHESLRTVFRTIDGRPVPTITAPGSFELKSVDLRAHSDGDRQDTARRLATDETRRPFDLASGPLLRASLFRISQNDHVLAVTMHHIVSDGWSLRIFFDELSHLYSCFTRGEPSGLDELPIQYADFASWQREWLHDREFDTQLAYWRQRLSDAVFALELPIDRPRPAKQTYRGNVQRFVVPATVSEGLLALGRSERATLFLTLLAAFNTLLHRITLQDDILVGTPVANRNRREFEPLIGFFLNTLVMRTDASGDPTFRELLGRVRERSLEAFMHQELPFEQLVEALQPERDFSRSPIFQVLFAFQNDPPRPPDLVGADSHSFEIFGDTAKFDLTLSLAVTGKGLQGGFEYATDLFDAATMQRLTEHFQVLLAGIVADPDRRLSQLPLLPHAERHRLLVEWNQTSRPYPREACIHDLVEQQVIATPDSIAVADGDSCLSYSELNRQANRLAHHLQQLGVGPDVRVGMCLQRSIDMTVALLAILKAGGAYVPLDPSYPTERLAFMLKDAKVLAVVTQTSLQGSLPRVGATMLCLDRAGLDRAGLDRAGVDRAGDQLAPYSSQDPTAGATADNLSYIIYTSGSTGKPKGVMLSHRVLVNLIVWQLEHPSSCHAPRTIQYSAASFDASLQEVFATWCTGATLCLVDAETRLDPRALLEHIRAFEVERMFLPPVALQQLAEAASRISPPVRTLRYLLPAGEQLEITPAIAEFVTSLASCSIFNLYGPSETHVVTAAEVPAIPGTLPPIGRAIACTSIFLLDARLQPVPTGTAGELFIGGDNLGRGYLDRPQDTAARFVPNPFGTPGERLYRSGDLSRYRPDGQIQFLGRIDTQVKIRGFRVELGEIEAVLNQHPGVRESVALAREHGSGKKRLVAYIVCDEVGTSAAAELRKFLLAKLPAYMVPDAFVFLDALPVTPIGKVDRRALPEPSATRPALGQEFVAPRTRTERELATIWAALLRVETIGAHDNFFELGGHSLLAMQVVSRITRDLGVEIPVRYVFESPTVADLAERVELVIGASIGTGVPAITRAARDGPLPLSFAQQRLWFLDQFSAQGNSYKIFVTARIEGALDEAALRAALREVSRRHEVLRTVFHTKDGQPVPVILPADSCEMLVVDLAALAAGEREGAVRRHVEEVTRRAFDLKNGPLLRGTLVRLSPTAHVIAVTMHHVVADGWSLEILLRELATLYESFLHRWQSPLAELPIQYADFALWQREWLKSAELERQLDYWRQRLAGPLPVLELATDRPRPRDATYHGAAERFALSTTVSEGLLALGRREGATLFMTLLAAFQTLLHRYTGQHDIAIGTPVANRNRPEVEDLIGLFVNTLVLRADLSGDPSFRELLRRGRALTLEALTHQDVPFEKIVEELRPERDPSRTPLFQVMFVLQNETHGLLRLTGTTSTPFAVADETAKFDLSLFLAVTDNGLRGGFEYATDLFDAATIRRLAEHFQVLLAGIVADPDRRLSQLPLLPHAERHRLLVEWNQTSRPYPREACIHELFEEQVDRSPSSVAVVFEGQHVTFSELDRRANQLAHHLQALGVGPEVRVALCLDRSVELVVAMLSVQKAGGAYLPLDPAYPKQRLAFLLEDADVLVLLTQQALLGALPEHRAIVLALDRDRGAIECRSGSRTAHRADASNLAYVIYTSGSTGEPKGVAVSHAALSNHMQWMQRAFPLNAADRVLQKTACTFDASVWEFYAPLLAGAQLVLARPGGQREIDYLVRTVRDEQISVLQAVPSLLRALLDEGLGRATTLARVFCGGETLTAELQERFFAQVEAELVNLYGPTEACIDSVVFACQRTGDRSTVPIGRPIDNLRAYVLDDRGRPVPVGVPGALHLAGAGLARGYLHRPAWTAERFLPCLFGDRHGEILYQTGDRARFRADGTLEYLGRHDQQIKLRGFRIELGEIETALAKLPGVREAVAAVREDAPGMAQLVAYYVCDPRAAIDEEALRRHLREQLPQHMLPAALVGLEALPLTPHGKIDRKALPAPDLTLWRPLREVVAPRTLSEQMLATIWEQLLAVEQIGVHDDFFERGGHSLLAMQVLSRIATNLGVELSVRDLFESPTVARLAERVDRALRDSTGTSLSPIARTARDRPLLLSFAQLRLWFLDQFEPNSDLYNIPQAWRLLGPLDLDCLRAALDEMMRRHEVLRTVFQAVDGEPVQVVSSVTSFPLAIVDLRAQPQDQREPVASQLVAEQARQPFDLATGPVLRGMLARLADEEHVLAVTMHHIVSDGWSAGIFLRELSALYACLCRGEPSPLAELAVQYADFAQWQREWLQGAELERQLTYWRDRLAAPLPALDLATDRPRSAQQDHGGSFQPFVVSDSLHRALSALGQREGATLFLTLMAAFQTLLHRHTQQDDIAVGMPVANRNRTEIEGLIGFFVNTLVLRTDLSGDPSFRELLGRVRQRALEAYAHQDLPFEKLVEELRPERDMSRSPIFQVLFAFQNDRSDALRLPGIQPRPFRIARDTAKFDLTLSLAVTGKGLQGGFEYATDLFDAATMQRLTEHFQVLLAGIVADPDQRLSQLPLLPHAERHRLLVEWNQTSRPYPREACIHDLVEQQVVATPDSIAVADGDSCLSYSELNRQANRLAHHLQQLGVGPDVRVGMCLQRSIDMTVALLAILKAGGAYVPLDPSYPTERLAFMLKDAKVLAVVTQTSLQGSLPRVGATMLCLDRAGLDRAGLDRACLDRAGDQLAPYSSQDPTAGATADNLSYIIYTSGSTGKPKGVMLSHRVLVNLIVWQLEHPSSCHAPRTIQYSAASFDASLQEVFATWCTGATLCLVDAETRLDPRALLEHIRAFEVERMFLPPVALQQLAEAASRISPPVRTLRYLLPAGEQLEITPAIAEFVTSLASCSIFNLYGPSETHVVTAAEVPAIPGTLPPIGRAIACTSIFLLDARLQPVPTGTAGELFIGGDNLGRGYLERPQDTAARFVPNPFGTPGERLYRSGDLSRYRPDGQIQFLGRIDTQVKIRGFRVELGEIEAVLNQHPGVRESVALAREHGSGKKRLVAYIVCDEVGTSAAAELRKFLLAKLPAYMVPDAFVFLDALPVTPIGKVDRRALPEPSATRPALGQEFVAPRTRTERELATIWAALLRVETIGAHDNFFELGGHSLLAMQVVSRITRDLGVEIPVRYVFESPTVADLAERVELVIGASIGTGVPAITRAARDGPLPLSFAQQRLWFLDQFSAQGNPYKIFVTARIEGALDEAALRAALREVSRRHEVLRTVFHTKDGQPVPVILPADSCEMLVVDLAALAAGEREGAVRRHVEEVTRRAFDLKNGPLLRGTLVRLSPTAHVIAVTMHHVVADGWSLEILLRELATLYESFLHRWQSPLAELPIQYADFALWQREWLKSAELERQLDYWRQRLAGPLPVLELATDRPRPRDATYHGAAERFALSTTVSEGLLALGRREGATLFMTLLAAFQTLLHRYTGQHDIAIGTPVANRNRPEVEDLIGLFVNTLVLRADLSGDPSFRELLRRGRALTLEALTHQDVPFEKIVEELRPERDPSRTPLFQVMFVLQNETHGLLRLTGTTSTPFAVADETTKFDLSLFLAVTDNGLRGGFEYATDLFDAATIRRLAEHFQVLLAGIVADPDRRLSQLPLLPHAERHRLLVEWNQTSRPYPREACIHDLVEQQVIATPDSIAVADGDSCLSYSELNRQANRLAHHLQQLGVGPDVRVGMCLQRSIDMTVAMLAILKAGGAYVPLDPSYPTERLAFMLADTSALVTITHSSLVNRVTDSVAKVVCLDSDRAAIGMANTTNPASGAAPENLAYVIYTSGSTGRPKGVAVQHRSLVQLCTWHDHVYGVEPCDRATQVASPSFDASAWELWPYLIAGASTHIPDDATRNSIEPLVAWLALHAITISFLPTPLAEIALEQPWPDCLRYLLTGGDRLTRGAAPGSTFQLVNHYGPTESTVVATSGPVGDDPVPQAPSIGRPIDNTTVYLLDPMLQPVPVGIGGELHIGGEGLARGYHARPGLTAERFLPDPFALVPGARLYRTGDRARFLAGGEIEFLGRFDQQIKLRGFRIELGEIETALAKLPGVREAVAAVREDAPGMAQLVAYYVRDPRAAIDEEAMRRHLREQLPQHMLPAALVGLEALPLTPHGKIDRKALPAPDLTLWRPLREVVAPRTLSEQMLATIWEQLLAVEQIGVHDDFFERGGHSLLAMQVLSRIATNLGVELSVRDLFESPTVARLAERVDRALRDSTGTSLSPIARTARDRPLLLSFAQLRLWFLDQFEPNSDLYNIPQAWRLLGPLDRDCLRAALDEMMRRHEVLRTVFEAVDGEPVQVVSSVTSFPLAIVDLRAQPQDQREPVASQLVAEQARQPFDLATGPVLRGMLARLADEEHVLAVTMHHIVSDGWSAGIFLRELSALYACLCRGEPSPLAELAVQYADFAQWQREWLQGAELERQLTYWRDRLAAPLPALDLATDRPRSAQQDHGGSFQPFVVSDSLHRALSALGQREGATLFLTLMAAFQTLLHRHTQQDDIAVGMPVANRNRTEIEGLIGFFVNTLVLRTDLSGDPSFRELLGRVRQRALEAYAHQDLPFEKLVEELRPERDMSRSPIFQVLFAFQNDRSDALRLPGIQPRPFRIARDTAKFDLTLSLAVTGKGLQGGFEYATDLFDAATMQRLTEHFQVLLAGIVADPERRLSQLPLLPHAERHRLLVEWNQTSRPYPREACIHDLVERQVIATPDSIAVADGDSCLSYSELNRQANRLAHHLQQLGVGPDVRVGMCLQRSIDMTVALLAILKAGGAYVPLDPDSPKERLAFMLADTSALVTITHSSLVDRVADSVAKVVCLDSDRAAIGMANTTNPASGAAPENLAYVIYTSGSTGRPKGVAVQHRSLVQLCTWHDHVYGVEPCDRATQVASPSFDASAWELWPYLIAGASTHIPDDATRNSIEPLVAWLALHAITISFLPTPLAEIALEQPWPDCLRYLLTGGDRLTRGAAPGSTFQLVNHYGPTESTVVATSGPVGDDPVPQAPSIGRPIDNTTVYLLDPMLQPVPVGIGGELHIGGEGLARGYHARPGLTAERFLPDPFALVPGARLYRTGDRARFLAGGEIEFLGRFDQQVKLRGLRIELGEIEAMLRDHPDIEAATVVAWGTSSGRQLAAYFVSRSNVSTLALRKHLRRSLPSYMVPTRYQRLDALPTTMAGKVDRKALARLEGAGNVASTRYVAPKTRTEEAVAAIWRQLLGIERAGIHDNFLDLGGHSLMAIRMVHKLSQQLNVHIALREVFTATLEQLAAECDRQFSNTKRT